MTIRLISLILSLSLFCQQAGIVCASGELNLADYLGQSGGAMAKPDVFRPVHLRYFSYDSANNSYQILLDKGDYEGAPEHKNTSAPEKEDGFLNDSAKELLNYFLIGLALPNDTFWVNLRPDAPDNIIDPLLEKTEIGKIFLEADLQLKKDTASLTSPKNKEGKEYWDKLYKKAGELFGTENITIPTITRPWIVPNEVIIRESDNSAYLYKATLKVMLEEDYLADSKLPNSQTPKLLNSSFSDPRLKELNEYSTQLLREKIIPKLTKEVNSSKRYAKLRQVYYSLVLSRWFKQRYGLQSAVSSPRLVENNHISLIDSKNLTGLGSQESWDKDVYFRQYRDSFAKGEYNLKENIATPYGQSIRSYVSGGLKMTSSPMEGVKTNKNVFESLMIGSGDVSVTVASSVNNGKTVETVIVFTPEWVVAEVNHILNEFIDILETYKGELVSWQEKRLIEVIKKLEENFATPMPKNGFDEYLEKIAALVIGLDSFQKYYMDIWEGDNTLGIMKSEYTIMKSKLLELLEKIGGDIKHSDKYNMKYELLKTYGIVGSPIEVPVPYQTGELVFWDGEIQEKRTLKYILGDELKEDRLKAIEKNKLFFMEKKPQAHPNVMEAIDKRNKELLSNVRFAFSGEVLEGYVVISKEGNSAAAIDAVAGTTQWIETALIIAGIQELADNVLPEYPIQLDNVLREHPYQGVVLYGLRGGNKSYNQAVISWEEFEDIIKRYYDNISKNVQDREEFRRVTKGASGSPLIISAENLEIIMRIRGMAEDFLRDNLLLSYPALNGRKLAEDISRYNLIREQFQKESLKEAVSRIYEYYLEKTVNEFKESAVSKDTKLKVEQWQKNKEDLEKILPEVTVDKLKNKIIKAIGKDVKDLAAGDATGDNELPKVKSLDGLLSFLTNYSTGLAAKKKGREESNGKLRSALSVLEKQSKKNGEKIGFEQENEIRGINDEIYINSYSFKKLSAAKKIVDGFIKEISQIRELTGVSSSVLTPGGIDFTDRAMFLKIERMGSFADLKLVLPRVKNARELDLDKEFRQIEAIASSGIVPNSRRILELFSACYYRGEFSRRLPQIVSSLKSSSALQESLAIDSDDDFRLAILMPEMLSGDGDIF